MTKRTKTTKAAKATKAAATKATQPTKEKVEKTAAAPAIEKTTTDADRAAAISKSWSNKAVAKARTTRVGVKVGRDEYASLMQAIIALKLDPKNMQSARLVLKREGKVEFGGVKFAAVTAEA